MTWCELAFKVMNMSLEGLEAVRSLVLARLVIHSGEVDRMRSCSDEMGWIAEHMEVLLVPAIMLGLVILHLETVEESGDRK